MPYQLPPYEIYYSPASGPRQLVGRASKLHEVKAKCLNHHRSRSGSTDLRRYVCTRIRRVFLDIELDD